MLESRGNSASRNSLTKLWLELNFRCFLRFLNKKQNKLHPHISWTSSFKTLSKHFFFLLLKNLCFTHGVPQNKHENQTLKRGRVLRSGVGLWAVQGKPRSSLWQVQNFSSATPLGCQFCCPSEGTVQWSVGTPMSQGYRLILIYPFIWERGQ